jgi:HPt (histidine-containing phosphotransfer) domain-containing protein
MIDWTRVNDLRNEVGPEDFDEVVDLFLQEVQEVIEKLRLSTQCADLEADLHFLKGSALSLGFSAFSNLCHTKEHMLRAGGETCVNLDEIIRSFEESKTAFLAQPRDGLPN